MHEARGVIDVADILRASYGDALSGTIAIDGNDGVGKTGLAVELQNAVGGTVLSLDDFVLENYGGYVPFLRIAELEAALKASSCPCIVEGVCILAALERISCQPDLLIYVKRIANYGFWHDESTCDPSEPVEELIERLSEQNARFAELDAELSGEPLRDDVKPRLTPLRAEIIRYHARYRPSRRADIVFSWSET